MGLMDKLRGMVNPDTIDDNYEDDYVFDDGDDNSEYTYEDYQQPAQQPAGGYNQMQQNQPRQQGQQGQQQYQAPMNNNQQGNSSMGLNSSNLEIKIIKPERYDSVKQIADHLLNRRTVVLNLESATKEDARRMIEFLTGVIYSINGGIKRVNPTSFILTPNNVDISAEQQNGQQMNRDIFNN